MKQRQRQRQRPCLGHMRSGFWALRPDGAAFRCGCLAAGEWQVAVQLFGWIWASSGWWSVKGNHWKFRRVKFTGSIASVMAVYAS